MEKLVKNPVKSLFFTILLHYYIITYSLLAIDLQFNKYIALIKNYM